MEKIFVKTGAEKVLEEQIVSWHAISIDEAIAQVNTTPHTGLDTAEVARRQKIYGLNQLAEKPRPSFFQLVISQLNSFVVILLIVASVISAILGDWVEAGAIMAIVVMNSVLGVIQESRAEEALAALKRMAAPEAMALRNGRRVTVPAVDLVPGDIIFLEAGNFIPADLRMLETVNLQIDEAALTGESVPVSKNASLVLEKDIPLGDQKNLAFMGTTVTYGRGQGVVVNTGMRTQLGLIADMLQSVEAEEIPLQKRLNQLGKLLGIGTLIICLIVFIIGFVRLLNNNGDIQQIIDLFMVAVSLAIAAVPEGLPAVVTISLALGMREMVRRHALIRRLSSVETLGSATVICSDKTGTLTQNEMTVTRLWVEGEPVEITGSGYIPQGEFLLTGKKIDLKNYPAVLSVLYAGVLNNDSNLDLAMVDDKETYRIVGDPTEGAFLVAAAKGGIDIAQLKETYPRSGEIPFDSERKRMVTVHEVRDDSVIRLSPVQEGSQKGRYAVIVKGAPDIVLSLCTHYQTMSGEVKKLDDVAYQRVLRANDTLTYGALRVLGLAYRFIPDMPDEVKIDEMEKDLIFMGLVGMIDPAREEVGPALNKARGAGIRTIMITGDYPNTARAIAESIGLLSPGHQVLTGNQLDEMDDASLEREVRTADVFARVSPEHKMRIVDALRANDQVVAMTGDGVNDAPAIKRADIGISMGITGTDVAKETADMVLTDDNYTSIVAAIEQGRIIYSNIRKFVYYLLSCNMSEIMIIFISTLIGWPSPLTAIQLLWLNLVTDGAPALSLATEKGDPDIMDRKPRPPSEPIINRFMLIGIVVQTIAITATTLLAYYIGLFTDPEHLEFAETMAFVTLSCSELLRAFTARSEYYPLTKIGIFKNHWMNYAVLVSLILILAVVYIPFLQGVFNTQPLGYQQWLQILPLLIIPSAAAELTKTISMRFRRHQQ
jgi:Ca2+-transporting ATPase